jgi:hypothetical protein
LLLKIFENPSYHVNTDARAFVYNVSHTEITGETSNSVMNHCGLSATGLMQAAQSFFKLLVSGFDDKTDKIDIMPGVMSAFVPSV